MKTSTITLPSELTVIKQVATKDITVTLYQSSKTGAYRVTSVKEDAKTYVSSFMEDLTNAQHVFDFHLFQQHVH